jgi:hypothetical protein
MSMRRLAVAVLVRLANVDAFAGQAIMVQQTAIAGLKLALGRQVVDRRTVTIAGMAPGHAAKLPKARFATVEKREDWLFGLAFAEVIATGAQADEGLQTRTEGAWGNAVGQWAACGFAAVWALERVLLIFADLGKDRRQLGDLVAQRQRIDAGQRGIAVRAGVGDAGDGGFAELLGWHHRAVGRRMVGLAAAFTSGRLFAWLGLGGIERIGRRRNRGIATMAARAFPHSLQLALGLFQLRSQPGNDVIPFATTETARAVRGVVLTSGCRLGLDHGRTLAASGVPGEWKGTRTSWKERGGIKVQVSFRQHPNGRKRLRESKDLLRAHRGFFLRICGRFNDRQS